MTQEKWTTADRWLNESLVGEDTASGTCILWRTQLESNQHRRLRRAV